LAAVDASRSKVAHPAQVLDFSRLLGEMRSEFTVPARTGVQNQGSSRNATPEARVSPQESRTTSRQNQNSTADSSVTRPDAGNQSGSAPSQRGSTAANTHASHDSSTTGNRETASGPAPNTAEAAASSSSAAQPADTVQNSSSEPAAQDAQLAEAAAEAGAATVAQLANQPAAATTAAAQAGITAHPAQVTALTVNPPQHPALAQQTVSFAAVAAHTALPDGTIPAAQHTGLAATALQGDAPTQLATPFAHLAAAQAQPALAAANPAPHLATAEAPVNPATLAPLSGLNAMADALAAQAGAAPATDHTGSAAALSLQLQEFNAMVAAARATSGTSLGPVAGLAEASAVSLASQPFAAPMPVGMMPGQGVTPTGATSGITAPLNSPQWPTELGRQFISITQAAKGLGQVAELRLDPPELGPLRITINLNDNVAHAVFSSPHALVRQTVENALPQLQQMLEQAGISLGQANVNDQHQSGQPSQDGAGQAGTGGHPAGTTLAAEGADAGAGNQRRPANPDALVDTFA